MDSLGVIAGFVAIDAILIGQIVYAVRDYRKHHEQGAVESGMRPRHR